MGTARKRHPGAANKERKGCKTRSHVTQQAGVSGRMKERQEESDEDGTSRIPGTGKTIEKWAKKYDGQHQYRPRGCDNTRPKTLTHMTPRFTRVHDITEHEKMRTERENERHKDTHETTGILLGGEGQRGSQ